MPKINPALRKFLADVRRSHDGALKAIAATASLGLPAPPADHWRARARLYAERLATDDPMSRDDAVAACAALALALAGDA
jgi:hypothetical protein